MPNRAYIRYLSNSSYLSALKLIFVIGVVWIIYLLFLEDVITVCCAGFIFWGCKKIFFCFQVSFCPVKRGNRAGSSRNEWVWLLSEGYPDQVPASRLSQLREFRTTAHFSIFLLEKNVDQTEPPFWSTVSFLTTQLKNELRVLNSRNYDSREAENWYGYLSESSHTHSEKSRHDFLSLQGNN